jgi:hypothetical protein
MLVDFSHVADYAHEAATVTQLIVLGGSPSAAFGA